MADGPRVAIRLGVVGDAEVKATLDAIGETGEAGAKRAAAGWARASKDVEDAIGRQAKAAATVNAMLSTATPGAKYTGDQNAQVKAYQQYMDQQRQAAEALRNAIDPLRVAQATYDRELERSATLLRTGNITEEEHAAAVALSARSLERARQGLLEHAEGMNRIGGSGMIAEHVVRSFSDSITAGQSPIRAFAMELPRAVEAMQFFAIETNATQGALGAFAKFMTGGFGLALTLGISLLGPLAAEMLAGKDAADKQADKVRTLTDAVNDLNKASGADLSTERQRVAAGAAEVIRLGQQEIATRKLLAARLATAQQEAATARTQALNAPADAAIGAGMAVGSYEAHAADLKRQFDANTVSLAKAEQSLRAGAAFMVRDDIANQFDAHKSATDRYKQSVDALTAAYKTHRLTLGAYRADVADEKAKLEAAIDATKRHGAAHTGEAAAMREAARDEADSINTVQALLDKANPDRNAYDAYINDMQQIRKRLAVGAISTDDATDAGRAAGQIFAKAVAAAAQAEFEADKGRLSAAVQAMFGTGDAWVDSGDMKGLAKRNIDALMATFPAAAKKITPAMEALRKVGDQMVDQVFNPQNWSNWGDMGKKVIGELEQELLKLAVLNPLKNQLFGESNPTLGGTGLFSSITKLFGGGPKTPGFQSIFDGGGYDGFASGTSFAPGGLAWVGENGPELMNVPRGASITPAGQSRRMAEAASSAKGGDTHVHVYAQDAVLAETVRGWVQQGVRAAAVQGAHGGAAMAEGNMRRRARYTLGAR